MQLEKSYKVVIVGAGPAGISTALNLQAMGIKDIAIVEKYAFPRYKCCAGYITNKTKNEYEKLGLNIETCHYSLIKDFNILFKNNDRLKIINKFLYTNDKIDRVELDAAFFNLAKEKGIDVFENSRVVANDIDNNILLTADGRRYIY
ncbi:MAG: FAD-dependent monooxygenase, partial [Clostridia bacterium]|nr:FAD-dependent monooxygenase [Clostridia bacterium]